MSSGSQGHGQALSFAPTPAGTNHPLATTPARPAQKATPTSDHPTTPLLPMGAATNDAFATQRRQIHPTRAPMSAPPMRTSSTSSSPSQSSNSSTLDELADDFLSQASYRTEQLGLAPMLRPSPLPPNENGIDRLRTLVERRAWGDVLKLATSLLMSGSSPYSGIYASIVTDSHSASSQELNSGDTPPPQIRLETVEVMMLLCHAWLKLRRYADLAAEIEQWSFLNFKDASSLSPDWLPWCLHILAAQIQSFHPDAVASVTDTLNQLRQRIPSSQKRWLCNIDNALSNIYLKRGEFRLALSSLERIIITLPDAVELEISQSFQHCNDPKGAARFLIKMYKCEIFSRQGRIFLQAGALSEAADVFEEARELVKDMQSDLEEFPYLGTHEVVKLGPCQIIVNEGLFYFAKSRYDDALQSFCQAIEVLRRSNDLHPKYRTEDFVGPTIIGCLASNTLYNESMNNIAICHLYMCNMKDAVESLEGVIREDPTSFLTDRIAFNLCTLYELGTDNSTGVRKKKALQLIAKRFFLHDIGPESFRVQ